MTKYFVYLRDKEGVAPVAQRRLIERYAKRNQLEISEWFFEGKRSAAKPRPIFRRMLRDLTAGKAQGVISDCRDRFSRNLAEWTELADLANRGIDFRFANERHGPLRLSSALISAVVRDVQGSLSFGGR